MVQDIKGARRDPWRGETATLRPQMTAPLKCGPMYRPLALPEDLPDTVRLGIDAGAEPLLRDVHTMLRLPMPAADLRAGCGFSIVNNLMSIVSGASVLLYSSQGHSGAIFK